MGEWKIVKLGELLELMRSGGTPDTNRRDYYGGDIPFVTIEDMSNASRVVTSTKKKLTPQGLKNSNAWVVSKGSLLYSVYATLGLVKFAGVNLTTNQAILALIPNQRKVHNNYLYFWLSYSRDSIIKLSSQTTQSNLSATIVKEIPVSLPPLPQQRRIAEILSTVDEAIERTEQLIAKQRQIKAGLMADLFTRGITPEGHLRPPPESAPHLYKDSPLGKIPKEWEVLRLGEILKLFGGYLQTGPFGSQLHAHEYQTEGVPVVMPQEINSGTIESKTISRISEKRALELSRHRMKVGDVVIARRGDLSRSAAIIPEEEGWVCGTGCFLLRLHGSALDPQYASLVYRQSVVQRQVAASAVGATMPSLNNSVMSTLLFPYCASEEQRLIVNLVESIQQVERKNRQARLALLKQKQGLMQDLLTGKKIIQSI